MAQPRFAILDTETTGLDESSNIIIELGIQLYTAQLELIAESSWITGDSVTQAHIDWLEGPQGDSFVKKMHAENGLIRDIRSISGPSSHAEVEDQAIKWLANYGLGKNHVQLPMCGSSIHFDRKFISAQMPELNSQFHYRNIDISSIKETARIYRPDLLEKQQKAFPPKGAHRVLDDCTDSRNELAFYVENLFLSGVE